MNLCFSYFCILMQGHPAKIGFYKKSLIDNSCWVDLNSGFQIKDTQVKCLQIKLQDHVQQLKSKLILHMFKLCSNILSIISNLGSFCESSYFVYEHHISILTTSRHSNALVSTKISIFQYCDTFLAKRLLLRLKLKTL